MKTSVNRLNDQYVACTEDRETVGTLFTPPFGNLWGFRLPLAYKRCRLNVINVLVEQHIINRQLTLCVPMSWHRFCVNISGE